MSLLPTLTIAFPGTLTTEGGWKDFEDVKPEYQHLINALKVLFGRAFAMNFAGQFELHRTF